MPSGIYDRTKSKPHGPHTQETKNRLRLLALKQFSNGMPEETKQKISLSNTGRRKTEQEKEAIRLRQMGNKNGLGHRCSQKTKKKMSLSARKGSESNLWKGGIPLPKCPDCKKQLSCRASKYCAECACKGERSYSWKGGIEPKNKLIRKSYRYKKWREAVFKRDDYTCVLCGKRGGIIHADHIKSFSLYVELRFLIDNGRTLCKECHLQTENYAGRGMRRHGYTIFQQI